MKRSPHPALPMNLRAGSRLSQPQQRAILQLGPGLVGASRCHRGLLRLRQPRSGSWPRCASIRWRSKLPMNRNAAFRRQTATRAKVAGCRLKAAFRLRFMGRGAAEIFAMNARTCIIVVRSADWSADLRSGALRLRVRRITPGRRPALRFMQDGSVVPAGSSPAITPPDTLAPAVHVQARENSSPAVSRGRGLRRGHHKRGRSSVHCGAGDNGWCW